MIMMSTLAAALALLAPGLIAAPAPEHARNPVLTEILAEGLEIGGAAVRLPEPTFRDDQSAEARREALRALAGSDRAVGEMLRDSVTAPHILKLRDTRAEGATGRAGDLYFVLRVGLDEIDPRALFRTGDGSGPIEAGNMRFEALVLSADDLEGGPVAAAKPDEWFIHSTGRLLDRIGVESTQRVVATRSADSLVIAGRTDLRFGADGRWPNRWKALDPRSRDDPDGRPDPYRGGIGYTKVSRLKGMPRAVVVESHFAFAEPRAWFDGAPILRSKLGLVAQDQVRRLRRELADASRRRPK